MCRPKLPIRAERDHDKVRNPTKPSMRFKLALALAGAVWLAAGCTSIPMGSAEDDVRGKSFTVKPGKANIYLYRHETLGFAVPMSIRIDGRPAGKTLAKTYLVWEVEPGKHTITSHAEDENALTLHTKAGESYYVWQEVKVGLWTARSLLQEVAAETGRMRVAECMLGKSML